jgi:hypothetical protein
MFRRVARLLSRIRPRRQTLTEEERLSTEEARLQALLSLEERQERWEDSYPSGIGDVGGVGGGGI